MECPKCHSQIDDNQTVCPVCKKVLLLECPNCHALGTTPICEECGYTILTKCSKCSKIIPTDSKTCPKCGFATSISLANNECETDDFASLIVEFGALYFNSPTLNFCSIILKSTVFDFNSVS